jgi:hypothetical protein
MKQRVRTGFTELTDGGLDLEAASAVKGLTDNGNFKLGDTFTQFTSAYGTYHSCMGELATGGKEAVAAKNLARLALTPLFSSVAIMVNQQAEGDKIKLMGSGIELAAEPEHHLQPLPINLQVQHGDNGAMIVSVKHSPVGDHGTIFAYTPATNPETDPNKWIIKSVNSHKTVLTGLTPAVSYRFTAAYKGTDDDVLVWAPPISKIVSD